MWETLLAKLRTLALYYQTAHWQSKGSLFYGDHLLFERLYNGVAEEIDGVAERAIGLTGVAVVNLNKSLALMSSEAIKLPYECSENIQFFQASLLLEQDILKFLEEIEPSLSLGSKDLIAALASAHESNLYLLKQRVTK